MKNLILAAVIFLGAMATAAWADPPATQPAKELTLDLGNKVTMKLVLIPAGKFLMGSPETEKDRDTDEVQHEVTISKPFYMGITHVTVDQFAAFVKDSGYKTDAEQDGWSYGFQSRTAISSLKRPMADRGVTRVSIRRGIILWYR